jgi:hypothetical protein
MLYSPRTLNIFGPFLTTAPIISVGIAYGHVAVHTYPKNKKVFWFLTAWYIFAFLAAQFPVCPSATEWGSLGNFSFFGAMPFVGIGSFYYFLYRKDEKVQDLLHNWPTHNVCAHQVYRLGGAIFLYLYMEKDMKTYLNLQTGVLDIFMGLTAIPMALYTRNKTLKEAKTVLLIWHAIGLYDLLSAFIMSTLDFFGIYRFAQSPAVIGFMPITLICYYQVAIAFGVHTLYLTSIDTMIQARENKKQM